MKFDDVAMDLVMDIKVPTATKWHRFTRKQIERASSGRERDGTAQADQSESDRAERDSILLGTNESSNGSGSGENWQSADEYVRVEDEESEDNA